MKHLLLSLAALCLLSIAIGGYHLATHPVQLQTLRYLYQDLSTDTAFNLMLGSSSIAQLNNPITLGCGNWLNRGMGGSTLPDLLRYLEYSPLEIQPDNIVIYAGENDIVFGSSVTDTVAQYQHLLQLLSKRYPKAAQHIIAIKPSPARSSHFAAFAQVNQHMQAYLENQFNAYYYQSRWDQSSYPLFQADGIHLNAVGNLNFTAGLQRYCQTPNPAAP